ncbi:hypothetical protein DSTSK_28370 [Desulforhabdus sp. TSK]|nr:hypothetical protein DSTSK_28370 [Desulforhabdus sp. TSK]
MKSDERILGDSDFVESALVGAREAMEWRHRLKSLGCDWGTIVTRVSRLLDVPEARIKSSGKEPERVKAKSIAAHCAVKELGTAGTGVGKELGLTQSTVSRAARRGEEIVGEFGLSIVDDGNASFHGRPLNFHKGNERVVNNGQNHEGVRKRKLSP